MRTNVVHCLMNHPKSSLSCFAFNRKDLPSRKLFIFLLLKVYKNVGYSRFNEKRLLFQFYFLHFKEARALYTALKIADEVIDLKTRIQKNTTSLFLLFIYLKTSPSFPFLENAKKNCFLTFTFEKIASLFSIFRFNSLQICKTEKNVSLLAAELAGARRF
jgi:hypothetical protein